MKIYKLSRELEEINEQDYRESLKVFKMPAPVVTEENAEEMQQELQEYRAKKSMAKKAVVILANEEETQDALQLAGIIYEGDVNLSKIEFSKVEVQQECVAGFLNIPKLSDIRGPHFKIQFFTNRKNIVIADDTRMSGKIIQRIRQNRTKPGTNREKFLYNYLGQFISNDQGYLSNYERRIAELEDLVLDGEVDDLQDKIIPVRRELLIFRSYYMELRDVGKLLEENENHFFSKRNLPYFGILTDRVDRLLGKTVYLLDYVSQVRDAYQNELAEAQNKNMEFLTIMSTIFYPLTLITGWYGMNFENMPELTNGYPFIIFLSIVVLIIIILIFKKRKIL